MSAADLAFVNGAVYTVNAARTRAQAVAVENGRVIDVGTDAEIREHVGPRDGCSCPVSRTPTCIHRRGVSRCSSVT
jgi:hypothetical protein